MVKKRNKLQLLETFDAFISELTKRKRRWTRAERELYEAVVRSLCKSAIRQQKQVARS